MNKLFHSSADRTRAYDLLVNAAKKNCEEKSKIKLNFKKIKKNFFSIKFIYFFVCTILTLKIFNLQKFVLLKYRGCNVGIHASAETFRDIKVFRSKFFLFYKLVKNLLIGGLVIDSGYNAVKKSEGLFINDLGYINGLLFKIFAKNRKIIYFIGYPRGFSNIDFNLKRNLKFDELSKLKIIPKKKTDTVNPKSSGKFIKSIIENTNMIKWMEKTKFPKFTKEKKILEKNLAKIDYVIYAHSFVDGQLWWGYDGFVNLYDWLVYTIDYLLKKNKKILLKGHPNFYNHKMFKQLSAQDREILEKIIKMYKGNKNFFYINFAVENKFIMKNIKKKTILISHHGTSLLEGSYLGFKSISSVSNFYSNKFSISNTWNSKKKYKKLLDKNYNNLIFNKQKVKMSLEQISEQVFGSKYNVYGKFYWQRLVSKYLNIKLNLKKNDHYLYSKLKNHNTKRKIINILSKNIEEVTF